MNKLMWVVKESSAGLFSSMLLILISTTIATLIFQQSLLPYFSIGLTTAILGAVIVNLITASFSSFPFAIARIEPAVGGVLAVLVFQIFTANPIPPEFVLPTLLFTFGSVSALTGIAMYIIGQFKFSEAVRFLPYPVLGGIIAGIGLEILRSSFVLLFENEFTFSNFVEHTYSIRDFLILSFSIIFFVVGKNKKYFWMTPLLIITSSLITYFVLSTQHISTEQAAHLGWINAELGHITMIPFIETYTQFFQFDWTVVFQEWEYIFSIASLIIIITALNVSALEYFGQINPNIEKEFKIVGVSNLIGGVLCCIPGNLSLTGSILNKNLGSSSRAAGILTSIFTLIIVFACSNLLIYLSKPILIAFLISIALHILYEWLHDGYQKMPLFDYLIMLTILIILFFKGLLVGLFFGLIISCLFFIIQYAKTNTVLIEATGDSYTSNVIRPHQQREFLDAYGDSIYIFKLQGYLFFGSIKFLINRLLELLNQKELNLKFLILDFQLVNNIDSSTSYNFLRLQQLTQQENITLVFTDCSKRILKQLDKMQASTHTQQNVFSTLDYGLEWCEEKIIQLMPHQFSATAFTIEKIIRYYMPNEAAVTVLLSQLERLEIPANSFLVKKNDPSDCLYFIESGSISIFLDKKGQTKRVTKSGPGTLIGEVGFFLNQPRTASILTETNCVVYRLTYQSWKKLEVADPEVTSQFEKSIISLLGKRLVHANRIISRLNPH